jgi:hypothetical protein
VKREGSDVTVIATSSMIQVALSAADELDRDGVSVEVVDPRTIAPLDRATLVDIGAEDRSSQSSSTRATRATARRAELAAVVAEARSGISTLRWCASVADGCSDPLSRRCSKTRPSPTPERVAEAGAELARQGSVRLTPTEVIMPALGMAQETGKLLRWIKNEGDAVTKGEPHDGDRDGQGHRRDRGPANGTLAGISAAEGDDVFLLGERSPSCWPKEKTFP